MFVGIRRRRRRGRKQQRPQHLTELTDESEEAKKYVAMNDSETDIRQSSTPSTANKEERWENELRIVEDDASLAEDRIFAAQRTPGGDEVVEPAEGKEERFRSEATTGSISAAQRIVDDLRERHSRGDGLDSEPVFFRRDFLSTAAVGDGFNLLRSCANYRYDDRRTSPTGNDDVTTTESYVIGKESHVTKLQSFVESLNDRTERGNRFFESSPFASGSFPLLPRMKPVYWTRHNNCSSLQANSAYDMSSQPSCTAAAAAKTHSSQGIAAAAAKTHSSQGIAAAAAAAAAAADGPLDLSTKRFIAESGVGGDSMQFEAQRMKIWGWGEHFEKSDQSTQAQNLRFLPFLSSDHSKIFKATHDLTESNYSIAAYLQTKDCWPNIRLGPKRRQEEINFHDPSTDVSSYLLKKSQSPETNENNNRKRKQRCLSSRCLSQENSAKRRKPNTSKDDAVNADRRNSLQRRPHRRRSSKCSGQTTGERGKDPDAGLCGERLPAIGEPCKRDDDHTTDRLRTRCNCGMTFDSLYRLAVHIQKSGHLPEFPPHKPGSSIPVCGQEGAWMSEETQNETAALKHFQRPTTPNGSVTCAGQLLVGTTGNDPTDPRQRHEADYFDGTFTTTDEPEMDFDGRNSVDRNLRQLFHLRSRLDAANGHRELGEESAAGFNEIDKNSAICGIIQRKLKRRRDEALIKNISKESPSDRNETSSIDDHLPLDENDQFNKTSEQTIRSVVCGTTDTFSANVDEDQRQSIVGYFPDQICKERFERSASVSPHSTAAAVNSSPENAAELLPLPPPPPPTTTTPLLRGEASSVVCRFPVGSDSSPADDDRSNPVSRSSRTSEESKERERRTNGSRDHHHHHRRRLSGVSKTPKLLSSTNARQRTAANETSTAVGGVSEAGKEPSQVVAVESVVANSDRQRSTCRRRRSVQRSSHPPREKLSSDLLLCGRRRFPGVAPQLQALAAGNSVGGDTRCSSGSPTTAVGSSSDLPFVLPSSDHGDGSFSLWAMKKFVNDHFCAQNNTQSTTGDNSTLSTTNYRITGDTRGPTTCEAVSRCSNNSRRLATTKRLQESLIAAKRHPVPSRKQSVSNRLPGNSIYSDATTEDQSESKGNASDVREEKLEYSVSGSDVVNGSASETDLSSTVLRSSRLQRQFSDESSSIADEPRNGITAVQSAKTTTGMACSSCFPADSAEEFAEKCADLADKIPVVFTKKKKKKKKKKKTTTKKYSADEDEFTGDYDKTRFPTPEETNLTASSSSTFPAVDYGDDDDSDRNSAAVDRFPCSESQSLEQVC